MYDKEAANANARLSTQLPYILAMSRFAHYLKAMMRDKIGSFMSRKDCETFLNHWILQYVVRIDDVTRGDQGAGSRSARRGSRWSEVPGKPGVYRAVAFLQAALPVGRAVGLFAAGGRSAAKREISHESRPRSPGTGRGIFHNTQEELKWHTMRF